jgi:hypothetical protein
VRPPPRGIAPDIDLVFHSSEYMYYISIYRTYYYTSVYIFYVKLNADKITILHINIQLLILLK